MSFENDLDFINRLLDQGLPLRPLASALPFGLLVCNGAGEIIFYSPKQAETDGLKAEEVLGQSLAAVLFSDDWPAPAPGQVRTVDCRYLTARGRRRRALVSLISLGPAATVYLFSPQNEADADDKPEAKTRETQKAGTARSADAFDRLIGRSGKFVKALKLGRGAAASPSPVLLSGETGTGKELFARAIHANSARAGRPFMAINCSAIPQDLLEGLLFGTARGAFTGAADRSGLFEEANGGTLFLDELDSMPLKLQPKLLRALQERKIRRVGSARELELDVKIISAVSTPPDEAVRKGNLRPDLFYRLGVMVILLPPLRERKEDLPVLGEHFLRKHNPILGRRKTALSPQVLEAFEAYDWPGNVRELEHIIEAALNVAEGDGELAPEDLPEHFSLSPKVTLGGYEAEGADRFLNLPPSPEGEEVGLVSLKDRERAMITKALAAAGGNVAQAARLLNISRQLLAYKMKKHELERDIFRK